MVNFVFCFLFFLSPSASLASVWARVGSRELQGGQPHLEKEVKTIVLETTSKHTKLKRVIWSSQQGLNKGE